MSFFKLIKYDIKNGLLRNWIFLFAPAFTLLQCTRCGRELLFFDTDGTWCVYVIYLFKGMEIVKRQTLTNGYNMPVFWILLILLPLFITFQYPFRDMTGMGTQILLRSGSRHRWWRSKWLWNLACAAVYILLLWGTAALYCLCRGIPLSMEISVNAANLLFSDANVIGEEMATLAVRQEVFTILILPFLVITALCMVEMLFSLVFGPLYSLLSCVAFLTAGTCAAFPVLFVNFANLVRSSAFVTDGLDGRVGLAVCIIVLLGTVLAGRIVFRNTDILPGKKEVF